MTSPSPGPATWQVRLAKASRPWLVRLNALPRAALLIGTIAVLAAGLFLPGVAGAVFLGALGLFLVWLALLAWPALGPGARAVRVAVPAIVLGYAVLKALGRA